MKVGQMFPRRYATGADLQGKPVTLTISRIVREKMRPQPGAPEDEGWVIYFKEAHKGVVLRRTLAQGIAQALGDDETDHWVGRQVCLYPQPMTVAGRSVIAIRARAAEPEEKRIGEAGPGPYFTDGDGDRQAQK